MWLKGGLSRLTNDKAYTQYMMQVFLSPKGIVPTEVISFFVVLRV